MENIKVRWALLEDLARIGDLLELNSLPRRMAYEEGFLVAEVGGEIVGALQYRMQVKRLLLRDLITDPWVKERSLAQALYTEARRLAREAGIPQVLAQPVRGDHLYFAGYHWYGYSWRCGTSRTLATRRRLPERGWQRFAALLGAFAIPFRG